ncbi:hypothetical protein [Thalassotalea litorea]|uniref:hypothetical protein n=1 Tax=Thalassotalea litorea TaxID=2020715 RepID=UPI003735E8FC
MNSSNSVCFNPELRFISSTYVWYAEEIKPCSDSKQFTAKANPENSTAPKLEQLECCEATRNTFASQDPDS